MSTKFWHFLTPSPMSTYSSSAKPLPAVDVHFIWSHFNTMSLSSDTSIYSQYTLARARTHARTHAHPFNSPFSRTTWISRYQKGKTNLDFTEARDSEWQWHQLGHMQVCTLLQTDNHTNTPPLSFLQAGCPSCRPTNSVKALKAISTASMH